MKSMFTEEQRTIRELSERLVVAQKPIRILDAIKWDEETKIDFLKHKAASLPKIDNTYYQRQPLNFDPKQKKEEFYAIERDTKRLLGSLSGISTILARMCREYITVVRLLEARGTEEFGYISQELFGSSEDVFYAGAPTLTDLAFTLSEALTNIQQSTVSDKDNKRFDTEKAVLFLQNKLNEYFTDPQDSVRVVISDGIMADAAAGADTIKLKQNARFSERDLNLLAVHEGWVHVGTTLNGLAQPYCTFLSKGPPSSTITQEGLAIIMEVFTFSSFPNRLRRITNRVNAVHKAESGANFLDIYQFFIEQGLESNDAYDNAVRVFRGSLPDGKPFTKDLAYNKGFILIYNYICLAINHGLLERIPLLFLGKTALEDLHIYQDLMPDGTIIPPKYVPPQFRDLSALTAWMCYSLFINKLSLNRLSQDYKTIL